MDKKYIRYVLESPITKLEINRYINKTTQPNVGLKSIQQFLFPLPPLKEQRRIVAKIEELLPLIDKYDKAYTKLTDFNTRFPEAMKKSLLQYAIEGKLVEQRADEGTAQDLIKDIQAEKKRLIDEKKIKKPKALPPITEEEIPFDIPEGWEWVRLQDIFQIINGDRGKNYPAKSQLSEHGDIPFISALNIKAGTIVKDNLLYVDEERYALLRSGHLQKGDLVLCIRGSLGKNGRYPFEKGAIASSLVILRSFVDEPYLYDFFEKYLNTSLFTEEIRKYDNGTAQPNLGARDLAKFLVPIPPLAEQNRIVTKLEELLPFCDQLRNKQN